MSLLKIFSELRKRKIIPADVVDVAKLAAWWVSKSPGQREARALYKRVMDEQKRKEQRRVAAAFAAGYMLGKSE